jgi:hypothetical protein
MILAQQQRGMSMMGMVFVLVVLATFGAAGLKLMPFYTEYSGIVRSLEQLKDMPDMATMSKSSLKKKLLNQLYVNSVRSIEHKNFKEYFKLKSTSGGRKIIADYTREAQFVHNIYLMAKFSHAVEFKR